MGISREYLLNIMGISWECHQNSEIFMGPIMGHIIGISWDIQPTLSDMSENGDPTIGSLKNGEADDRPMELVRPIFSHNCPIGPSDLEN